MPRDKEEKDESQRTVRVAKSTMKLPRHAGGGDGKHQRIQRQMPRFHRDAACRTPLEMDKRPDKADEREQKQQQSGRLVQLDERLERIIEIPGEGGGEHQQIAGGHRPVQRAGNRAIAGGGIGLHKSSFE